MAKKTKKEPAKQEVDRIDLGNGTVLVKYDDGSVEVVITTVLPAELAQQIFGNDSDSDEDDDDEVTPEMLAEADFEELEDICDEKELDTDPDDFDEGT